MTPAPAAAAKNTKNAAEGEIMITSGKTMKKHMTDKRYWEDTERKLWKLITEDEVDYKGQVFRRLTWVYPCGGAVECRDDLDEKSNRIYIVERFELSPKSWVKERPIADAGSLILTEKFTEKEEALELAAKWRGEVIPCEVCETEKSIVFRFKTGVKPRRVKRGSLDDFQRFD